METNISAPLSGVTSNTYERSEVLTAALKYFDGDELAATTWMNKYAMKQDDEHFSELDPDDMHHRLARQFARIEEKYSDCEDLTKLSSYGKTREKLNKQSIYELFQEFKYVVPQGSVMAALGNTSMLASLSNCVVVHPPHDSYGGILYTDQQLAQLFKRRCGVGFDISSIRPKGLRVNNSAGSTTGAVSFMERFSNTTREVSQLGRRGALMITMDVRHPEILDFVKVKQDLKKVTGANVSIRITDEFMKAVQDEEMFMLRWPIEDGEPLIRQEVNARQLWDEIVTAAHRTAEPGIIFWDSQHNYSTSSVYPNYKNSSTNPCSEIAMQGGDSCRLIALNLFNFVEQPFSVEASFDFEKFYRIAYEGQRLNDDLVDLELEAVEKILKKVDTDPEPESIKALERETWEMLYRNGANGRRTGLGFTALADTIAALGHKYDSPEALELVKQIMMTKCRAEFDSSIDMAVERGAFTGFDPEVEQTSDFVGMLQKEFPEQYERMMNYGRRNISLSTVAPTGTLSMMTQTSSGIEPVFMLSYKRRRKVSSDSQTVSFVDESGDSWEEFEVRHHKLNEWSEVTKEWDISKSPYAGATAQQIDWIKRVEMQSLIQRYVTHSISSTINLPSDVSVDKVSEIYLKSWQMGLKGITVYRDGSRAGVLVDNDQKPDDRGDDIVENIAPPRPQRLNAKVIRFMNDHEKWLAFVGLLNGRPYEIFTGKARDAFDFPKYVKEGWVIKNSNGEGKSRYDFQYEDSDGYKITIEGLSRSFSKEYWNYAKLISGILRHGMPLVDVVHLVSNLNLDKDYINTWKNGIARSLKTFIPNGTQLPNRECPECGDLDGLIYEEGCLRCKSCSYTKCG